MRGEDDGFQTRAARLVDRKRRHGFGNACAKSDLARDVWTTTGLARATPDRVVDFVCGHVGAAQSFLRDRDAHVRRAPRLQRAAEFADGCSYRACEINVLHFSCEKW